MTKSLVVILLVIATLGAMVATNPTIDDYANFLRQELIHNTKDEDDLTKGIMRLFGGLAGSVLANATIRTNYVLFSTYYTELETQDIRYLGIFGNFVSYVTADH